MKKNEFLNWDIVLDMEDAGLTSHTPTIFIRGICDYADSAKSQQWQDHLTKNTTKFTEELRVDISGEWICIYCISTASNMG